MKRLIGIVAAGLSLAAAGESRLKPYFGNLPEGMDPGTISRRITDQFLSTRPENYRPAGYRGNGGYGWNRIVQYSVVSTWLNAIECARLTGDAYRERRLVRLFDDFLPGGSRHRVCSRPWHVDDTIFGALPLEIALREGDPRYRKMGLAYADNQWCAPCERSFRERESAPREVQEQYYRDGYSVQTRLWIDDMYMITVLQSQAYRLTGERKYIERAAKEMTLYLDRLQLKEGNAKGLFYHAPDVPFVWCRGDGWMAAGMALLLSRLPEDSPHRARIMAGYREMMATLLRFRRADGLWCQLVDCPDEPENWAETSGSAMFAYAFAVGVRNGWLDAATYGPAARQAYLALCSRFDVYGNISGVCEGTGKRNSKPYYYARRRVNGDPHGQAPMLWIAGELLAEKVGDAAGRVKSPETSKLFERRVDPVSKVVSYALLHGAPDDNRQSLYFITKSMTEDGRYLLFWHTKGNERQPACGPRHVMMADLLKDEVIDLGEPSGMLYTWFVECRRNYAVYADDKGDFWRLPFADPSNRVRLCATPRALTDIGRVMYLATHLTLTRDRTKAFLDVHVRTSGGKPRYIQGLLTLATGEWEQWGETDFMANHGQLNPADDRLAMVAWEAAWERQGQEYRRRTGHYPRMWLVEPGNRRRMIPAEARNFASHEIWDDDGRGFSWCGWGSKDPDDTVYHCDLATGRQEKWCGIAGARHNSCSPDNKYVVTDVAPERWWRGCKWRVGFWNRETGKAAWIYTTRPALMPRSNQSKLHPDPHPHFVMNAKYVVSTANNADGHMDLYVTPVAPLVEMTK